MIERRAPIVWAVAGLDSGGGAGLSADQRAADAFDVHLCPVLAALTAQNTREVTRIDATPCEQLDAAFDTLGDDLPATVIKTGLLGGAAQIECVARRVDQLGKHDGAAPALVVDPVLSATTGARFADTAALDAYRKLLLPRATLITPNRREAIVLTEAAADTPAPTLARRLRELGARAVCITGGDDTGPLALDWLDTDDASGWLALPRIATADHHGTGCTFASSAAAAIALGFADADALVLAKMATAAALARSRRIGQGSGPVIARCGFVQQAHVLPALSFGDETIRADVFDAPCDAPNITGLYAIVDSVPRLERALAAGIRIVQLRIKSADATLRQAIERSIACCRAADAALFINDHWDLAVELGAPGVHLGQSDLSALNPAQRASLAGGALALGVSSHNLAELARAKSLRPAYIACGPVWPTTTKQMPWRAQGLGNLAWWCSVVAPTPVVAIGGILSGEQITACASHGARAVCLVRGLGDQPTATVPALRDAFVRGHGAQRMPAPGLPHPSLMR